MVIERIKKIFAVKNKQDFKIDPYVVQMNGNYYLTKDGTWTKDYEPSKVFIPLEEYEFKDWQ